MGLGKTKDGKNIFSPVPLPMQKGKKGEKEKKPSEVPPAPVSPGATLAGQLAAVPQTSPGATLAGQLAAVPQTSPGATLAGQLAAVPQDKGKKKPEPDLRVQNQLWQNLFKSIVNSKTRKM